MNNLESWMELSDFIHRRKSRDENYV